MEPIISKLQEGVKYPRFERDATKTINDLVEHITKERGIYSSSIEPNPNEHSIWFNTNDNKIYKYIDEEWKDVNANRDFIVNLNRADILPYPYININYDSITLSPIDEINNYIIITSTRNIVYTINKILSDIDFILINENNNSDSGTFVIHIYNNYVYYYKIDNNIVSDPIDFYVSEGDVYYKTDGGREGNMFVNDRFYLENDLYNEVYNETGEQVESRMIIPSDESIVIVGNHSNDLCINGDDSDNVTIYVKYNSLVLGENNIYSSVQTDCSFYNLTINCYDSGYTEINKGECCDDLYLSVANIITGANTELYISEEVSDNIEDLSLYIIPYDNYSNNNSDTSSVYVDETNLQFIDVINLCKSPIKGGLSNTQISSGGCFWSRSAEDFSSENSLIDWEATPNDAIIVIDIDNTENDKLNIDVLKSIPVPVIYTTSSGTRTYLSSKGVACAQSYKNLRYNANDNSINIKLTLGIDNVLINRTIYI